MEEQVKFAVTMSDGSLTIWSMLVEGRSPSLPYEAYWVDDARTRWRRDLTDKVIAHEIFRAFAIVEQEQGKTPARFRRISDEDMPRDRTYRVAWVDHGEGPIGHDMEKAREHHLRIVREVRGRRLDEIDRDWMRAAGQEDRVEAKRLEKMRQELRDLPATLDLESAQTIEDLRGVWHPLLGDAS